MHGSPKQKTAKNVNLAQTSDLKTTNERDDFAEFNKWYVESANAIAAIGNGRAGTSTRKNNTSIIK